MPDYRCRDGEIVLTSHTISCAERRHARRVPLRGRFPAALPTTVCATVRWNGQRPSCLRTRSAVRQSRRPQARGAYRSACPEAIAQVESGRPDTVCRLQPWLWTIGAKAGVPALHPSRKPSVRCAPCTRAVCSIDVGCLQFNLRVHPAAFASLEEAFDLRANALPAARFLSALRASGHGWLNATADNHAQIAVLGTAYRRGVLALWHDPSSDGHLGLAITESDSAPQLRAYDHFAPVSSIYGAFAGCFSGPVVTPRS
jgi:hypothetical protein